LFEQYYVNEETEGKLTELRK